jgi:hypothetical protein
MLLWLQLVSLKLVLEMGRRRRRKVMAGWQSPKTSNANPAASRGHWTPGGVPPAGVKGGRETGVGQQRMVLVLMRDLMRRLELELMLWQVMRLVLALLLVLHMHVRLALLVTLLLVVLLSLMLP